jgi:hypothetical protein
METQPNGYSGVLTTIDQSHSATDLRQRLLGDLHNIELRQKYLATRTPEWTQADIGVATERLRIARLIRGFIGLAIVGGVGGAIGVALRSTTANGSSDETLPLLVALGSSISGSISFAALAALGCVVLPEIVGEDKLRRQGRGVGAFVGHVAEQIAETACGAIWGAVCGLLIGVFAWAPAIGLAGFGSSSVIAGAIGGALLAVVFSLVILSVGPKAASAAAFRWAHLGPLPLLGYLLPFRMAHGRYLRSIRTVKFSYCRRLACTDFSSQATEEQD